MTAQPSEPNRTCGSCGAPVSESDEICPQCGALLAAYERPRGSEGDAGTPISPPVTSVPIPQGSPEPPRPRETAPVAPVPTGTQPEPAPTQAAAPSRPAPPDLASTRKKAQPVPPRAEPRPRAETRTPTPRASGTSPRRSSVPARTLSTREIASTAGSIGRLALGILMILVVMGILDFDLIPILVLGVVLLSLLGIMRSAAKASGRKTTSMYDPKRRDGWRR